MSTATIVLAGCPNAGKTSLFNALTGARQKVGNYPGVTVERKSGQVSLSDGRKVEVIDLPGTYSLVPDSPDERIAVKLLLNQEGLSEPPALIVAVADATNLERTLGLALDLKRIGRPLLLAVNMYDLACRRGLKIDCRRLARELGMPVVPTVAVRRGGTQDLVRAIERHLVADESRAPRTEIRDYVPPTVEEIQARTIEVEALLGRCIQSPTRADVWSVRLDRVFLHPVFGVLILGAILLCMFQAVFSWAERPMTWIETGIGALAAGVGTVLPEGFLRSFIADGIIAGVGSVLVFLPQILILFLFIFLLEGSGYMMRAAFVMDRLMAGVGLQGRAFVPLLSSFACAIPGIMATRTIKQERDRLLTILVAPLMTCSARLPVYVLLIGAFIPNVTVFGPFKAQGLVMFGLFLGGIVSAMVVAMIFRRTMLKGPRSPLLMELPGYKWPSPRVVALNLLVRTKAFLKRAGTVILGVSVALWLLSSFPAAPQGADRPAVTYSFAGRIGLAIEPLVAPLGFDWRIATGLVPGLAAREVMVSALGTVFAVENADDEGEGTATLQETIKATWPVATGLALLVWYIFAPQCLATFAVVRRETGGWKWPAIMFTYMLGLAWAGAWVTRQIALLFSA